MDDHSHGLPIEAVVPDIRQALADGGSLVLAAPPGAGKTTHVPLALLNEAWLADRAILMLEPRRVAARAAAARMAETLGEGLGQTVGYRIRDEARVSARTRIEVVTEGILTRRLQADPELEGVALVIFDEFHERNLHADVGLALCREIQAGLREDLRLLVMSATLDTTRVADYLNAARVESAGRAHPVSCHHRPPRRDQRIESALAAAARHALDEHAGGVLAFLPGEGEIRRAEKALEGVPDDVDVLPLYGRLSLTEQQRALAPAPPGRRKLVLATAVAETSLTIADVRVVIDSGLSRSARFDPASGFATLVTGPVSAASATQRAGRAGRTAPGVCYRLWPQSQVLNPHDPPEISVADLAPTLLEFCAWGDLPQCLDPPPAAHLDQARDVLTMLGALDSDARITPAGRRMLALGLHPRLAAMLLGAGTPLAADLCALIESRESWRLGQEDDGVDLHRRWLAWRRGGGPRALRGRLDSAAARFARRAGIEGQADDEAFGETLALAYPDRVAGLRPGSRNRYRLAYGRGAELPGDDALCEQRFLVVAELGNRERIRAAAALDETGLRERFADRIVWRDVVEWDERAGEVVAARREQFGALVLSESVLAEPDAESAVDALVQGIHSRGLSSLGWDARVENWLARVRCLARVFPGQWPALEASELLDGVGDWLRPWLYGRRRPQEVGADDLLAALQGLLPTGASAELDRLAPRRLGLPGGREVKLDYQDGDIPVLASRLQDFFGMTRTPTIADGRLAVKLHLLSPARRPLAVTQDLASFWQNAYPEVRKQMRGRYPKHPWPEDPLAGSP